MSDEFNGFEKSSDSGGFSFESILAEVKGSAFINGDKRTPPDILQEKADRILREAAELSSPKPVAKPVVQQSVIHATHHTEVAQIPMPDAGIHYTGQVSHEPEFSDTDGLPMIVTPLDDEVPQGDQERRFGTFSTAMEEASSYSAQTNAINTDEPPTIYIPLREDRTGTIHNLQNDGQNKDGDGTVIYFDKFRDAAADGQNQETKVHNIHDAGADEYAGDESQPVKSKWGFGKRERSELFDQETFYDDSDEHGSDASTREDEILVEPDLRDAVRRFASSCNSISIRVLPASVITLLMIAITYAYEAGMTVPFGIGHNLDYAAGTLIICLLVVMMLCSDVIVRGVEFIIRGVPNAETLIFFSCLFSLISAAFTMISGAALMLPFCAVSAMSLTFAAFGEKYNLRAITDTLKTAVGSSEPYGVQAEYNADIDKSVLKKVFNRTDGFYNNLMQPDITELVYSYAAPALLTASLLLTVMIVLFRGGIENSIHILSALLAAAAPFSALLSFSIPFATVVRSTRKSGSAVAGWGGADDICFSDGVCVTDDDLFPPGMLRLSGVKVYDGATPENAIRYTASLILSSGSGLTSLFSEVLKQQGFSTIRVSDFECHESGIAGIVGGAQVSTGSAAFMNLLGVRVPDDTNMKNAVYTAVNNRLQAMFAVDYKPLPSVQSALISMLKWRIDLYFAMRDFNVTPAMVGQKFKVPFDSFVFIPAKDSYSISDLHSTKAGRMAAVLVREGLNPFAEAITGGRLLKSAALFATILSVVSAALGVLIMFYMCWTGSFVSASPGNLVVFMLCMLVTVMIVCGYVRLKK